MKKTITSSISFAVIITSLSSIAHSKDTGLSIPGEFSANVAITSDYSFRGITQSDEGPAIQGGIDYSLDIYENVELYLGTWASTVDFSDNSEASSEFDWYGGFTYKLNDVSFDIGAIYYSYPNAENNLNYDFWEGKVGVGYDLKVASVSASINFSPENFGDSGNAEYYALSSDIPLSKGFVLDGHIGRQNIEDNATFGVDDYTDWSVGLSNNFKGLDLKVQYVDTDIDKSDCADGCDAKVIFTVSKAF